MAHTVPESSPPSAAAAVRLTPAERAVVRLVLTGCSNREIAAARGSSEATVKHQLFRVYLKLGIHSRTRLMALAARGGAPALHCPAV